MQALVSDYGKHTWAGQHDSYEISYIQGKTGRKPAIVEGDLIDYSPSRVQYGGMPNGYTEGYISLQNTGHVLGLMLALERSHQSAQYRQRTVVERLLHRSDDI